MTKNEPVCISTYSSEFEAELAKMKLDQNGIASFLAKDDCGGMLPFLQTFAGVRLMVRSADAEAAAKLIAQLRETEHQDPSDN